MKSPLILALACATSLAAAGCAAPSVKPATDASVAVSKDEALASFKAAIREKYDLKEKAFAENDAETIVTKFYASDARSVSANDAHTYAGVDEFRKTYSEVVPTANVKIESVETYLNGDAGWDWANFHVTPKDASAPPFTFMILFLWSKENGEWISKGDFYSLGEFASHADAE
jgi:hypothetical protein